MGLERIRNSIQLRYGIAIVVTAALMIWISINEERDWQGIPGQIAFWSISITAGWLQMILIARGVRASFGTKRRPGWVLLLITALIGAVPLTFEVRWLLETIIAPALGLPPPWLTYLNVTVINTVFCTVQYTLIECWPLFEPADRMPPARPANVQPLQVERAPRPGIGLLSRPPEGLSGTIKYMRMEDHYLRVFTDEGDDLTLHRMSDAQRELSETDGMQVHKSWWVSAAAIDEIRQQNRKRVIRARDGTEIPVGRSYESKLKDAGWI